MVTAPQSLAAQWATGRTVEQLLKRRGPRRFKRAGAGGHSPRTRAVMGPRREEGGQGPKGPEAAPMLGPRRFSAEHGPRAPGRQGGTRPEGENEPTRGRGHGTDGGKPRAAIDAQGQPGERADDPGRVGPAQRPEPPAGPTERDGAAAPKRGESRPPTDGPAVAPTRPPGPERGGAGNTLPGPPPGNRGAPGKPATPPRGRAGPSADRGATLAGIPFKSGPCARTTGRGRGRRPRGTPAGNMPSGYCQPVESVNPESPWSRRR